MKRPAHTPYDGSAKPFAIGLKPLDPQDWIEVDNLLGDYLAEKDRLYAEIPEKVFMAESGTEAGQREVLETLVDFLPARFPDSYRRDGSEMTISGGADGPDRIVQLDAGEAPLKTASRLVQEDLVLMRKGADGWRLAAASLCFPSSWSLAEKFGKPLHEIHRPVPEFGPGTRSAELIERMFDKLQGQAVWRLNWSLAAEPSLYLPLSQDARMERAGAVLSRFGADPTASAFIRVERQTLRKMPLSGDILFTIRIYVDPMRVLLSHPDRATLAAGFADQLAGLDEAQMAYKGLHNDRDRLIAALRTLAAQ